jgi:hypothetical protein
MGVYFRLPEGQKGNIGLEVFEEIALLVAILEGARRRSVLRQAPPRQQQTRISHHTQQTQQKRLFILNR